MRRLFKIEETSKMLGMSVSTLRRKAREDRMPSGWYAYKIENAWRFSQEWARCDVCEHLKNAMWKPSCQYMTEEDTLCENFKRKVVEG